ncbi:DUF4231 domain-containing protein [Nocardia beijingensis]|uniref:DUF4231 domain-containing protein n=1 Tax=Nocardia beijingensis TaxID=95162 RepID=UPI0018955893|nr:DUF4231 domain-containing protein [Nocardia beijingensis]MBF6465197.1 DUF4231 domain-containing protein [Nocardia beijingensis]
MAGDTTEDRYAAEVADRSYDWYSRAAVKARRYHRLTEVIQLVGSAAIPVSAVLLPENTAVPALLGAVVVITTGLRSAFHWQDDYLRFSQAREAVEAERRLFRTGAAPYDDPADRDQVLAQSITGIEQKEMNSWLKIAGPRRHSRGNPR